MLDICLVCRYLKAPACSIGEVARALVTDEAATSSLADASKVDHSHSERNAHRLFNRYGLALKVPISELKVANDANEDFVTVPYLRMRDYIQVLLKQHPEVLLGGLPVAESQGLLRTFWQRYRVYHDKHIVFQHYDESVWGSLIPVFVHGDKGRTLGKSPIFVLSWEIPFGLPPELLSKASADSRGTASKQKGDGRLHWSCEERTRFSGKRTHAQMNGTCTVSDPDAFNNTKPETCHQRCNNKGHSYLSRFLIAAITSKTYKQNSKILPSILQETATELDELFYTGLEVSGVTFRFAFLGAKGDAEWHFEAGAFNRSYHKTGVKRDLPICPHCEAGKPGLSISDAASEPPWAATLGTTDPWEELPPLNHAPYAATFKAGLYKFDPFHVLKFGVFRDAVGSVLVRLCMMGYFDFCSDDSDAIEARFERAFAKFKLWCMASKKFPAIRQFSKANMHFEAYRQFAWVNCKGSDVTLIMMFLEFFLRSLMLNPLKDPSHKAPVRAMYQMLLGGLTYIGIQHSHGIWLPRPCAETQLAAGLRFYRGYLFMADHCMKIRASGFRLRPKIHYYHHLLYDVQLQLRSCAEFIYSAATWLCESNEDFIGRISRVSRRVAARTAGLRTTQRYLVKMRALLKRLSKD